MQNSNPTKAEDLRINQIKKDRDNALKIFKNYKK